MQRNAQRDHDEINSSTVVTPSTINSLTRIRSSYPTLAASEMRVVDRVMQQPEKIMQFSMTLEVLEESALVKAIGLINNARQLLLVGVGTSVPIVQSMYNMLMRLGINCKVQTDSYLQLMEVALLGTGYVIIALGNTDTTTQNEKPI